MEPIIHNDSNEGGSFDVIKENIKVATLTYTRAGEKLIHINHTIVNNTERGTGIGKALVDAVVDWARANQIKIIPMCSYVKAIFAKADSYKDIIA